MLIEPHPNKFEYLKQNRPNNFLFDNLISCHKEPLNFKYFIDDYSPVSGVENTLSQHHFDNYFNKFAMLPQNTILLIPKTLTDILKSTNLKHIDFLSLDVEGHEYEVLQSWDFSIPIDLILIETLGVQPDKDELCRQLLISNGYKFIQKFSHNEIFINNYVVF